MRILNLKFLSEKTNFLIKNKMKNKEKFKSQSFPKKDKNIKLSLINKNQTSQVLRK